MTRYTFHFTYEFAGASRAVLMPGEGRQLRSVDVVADRLGEAERQAKERCRIPAAKARELGLKREAKVWLVGSEKVVEEVTSNE